MKKIFIPILLCFFSIFCAISIPNEYQTRMEELNKKIAEYNISLEWFKQNIDNSDFKIYYNIPKLFSNMAENRYKNYELTLDYYMKNFKVEDKVKKGLIFIENNKELLFYTENKNGIHNELIVALLAIETDFGNKKYIGEFYIFPCLITQYLLMPKREEFALRELYYLYLLKSERAIDLSYTKGSFAAASGLGQFIPSSIYSFFIDSNSDDQYIDIFSVDDNITSIENYLYKNGLNGENITDKKELYKAVYSYNRSDAYVKTVIYIYKELYKNRLISNGN